MELMNLAANLEQVQARIQQACDRADRDPQTVTLLAVSKGHPPETVCAAAELGLTLFGESKVQEAKVKIPLCPGRLRWHMIGHLQTNKGRDALHLFTMIESVDSVHLAEEIDQLAAKLARSMPILLQVNVVGEATKFGFSPKQLLADLERINELPRLAIHGLMTIAPYSADPERARPCFQRLRELKLECEARLGVPLPQLSMGMSGDLEVAIEEGATLIRVGTSLLGKRNSRARNS